MTCGSDSTVYWVRYTQAQMKNWKSSQQWKCCERNHLITPPLPLRRPIIFHLIDIAHKKWAAFHNKYMSQSVRVNASQSFNDHTIFWAWKKNGNSLSAMIKIECVRSSLIDEIQNFSRRDSVTFIYLIYWRSRYTLRMFARLAHETRSTAMVKRNTTKKPGAITLPECLSGNTLETSL